MRRVETSVSVHVARIENGQRELEAEGERERVSHTCDRMIALSFSLSPSDSAVGDVWRSVHAGCARVNEAEREREIGLTAAACVCHSACCFLSLSLQLLHCTLSLEGTSTGPHVSLECVSVCVCV